MILFLCGSLFAGSSSSAVDELSQKHTDLNSIHEAHLKEFNNIRKILGKILLSQANNIFELYKEAELLFLTMQGEGEYEIMTNRILGIFK